MKQAWILFSLVPLLAHAASSETAWCDTRPAAPTCKKEPECKKKEPVCKPKKPVCKPCPCPCPDDGNPANRSDACCFCLLPPGNSSAKDGAHIFVTGDALFWIAKEDDLDPFTIAKTNVSSTENPIVSTADERSKNLNFKWDWGSRISLGSDLPHDQWDLSFAWTRFHTSAKKQASTTPVITTGPEIIGKQVLILPNWSLPIVDFPDVFNGGVAIKSIFARWKMHLDLFDLNLGRKFFVSKWLTLRPNAGVRAAIIDQRYKIVSTAVPGFISQLTVVNDTNNMKNNYRAIGLLAGLDTQWGLFNEFSFYGNAAISLLYGRFHVDQREALVISFTSPGINHDTIRIQRLFHSLKAVTDLAAGLQWDHYFACGRLHLGMHVGWEYHLFFGQNQLRHNISNTALIPLTSGPGLYPNSISTPAHGDLSLQGGVAGIRLDF